MSNRNEACGTFTRLGCLLSLVFSCGLLQGQSFTPVAPLSFVKVFGGADPLPQILEITSTGSNFGVVRDATTNSGGNWLTTVATGFNCCSTPRSITVGVVNSASMAAGTYTGQITFTAFNNNSISMVVPVTLTVQPAGSPMFNNIPGQLSFTLKTHGASIANRIIEVKNGGGGTLNWSVAKSTADGGDWLTVSPGTGTAPSPVTVGVVVSNLPNGGVVAGKFTGQVVFTQASGGSVTVPVSVVVDADAFSQINGLSFSKVFGGGDPLAQVVTIPSTGTNFNFDTDWYTSSGGNWLKVVPVGFNCCTTPRAVNVEVTTAVAMPVGTYAGEIVFTGPEINGAAAMTVHVTLTVEPTGGAFFNNLPGQLSFAMKTGGNTITSQAIQVLNGGQGNLNWSLAKTTGDGGDWLTVSTTSGTAPSQVVVGVTPLNLPGSGLLAGEFIGELVFFNSAGGTVTVPVSVIVGSDVFRQINGISFEKVFGGANPLPQVLTIPSTGNNFNYDTSWYTSSGGNWLKVVAVGFNCCATPRAVNVEVTTDVTMPAGTYTGEIVFTGPEINGASAITVPVTLTVKPAGTPFFNNVPGHLGFSLKTGNTKLTSQTFQLVNGGQGSLDWSVTASTADGGGWLTVSPGSGTAPSLVTVGIVVANLPNGGVVPGQFIGQLVFTQSTGGSVTVPVSVVVGADIFRQVNGISFTKVFGQNDPLAQELLVASTGANFNYDTSWYTSSGGNWLKVVAVGFNCCTTPRAVTVEVTADSALPVGTYAGEIVFTGPEINGASAITVPVTLTIVPPTATFIDDVQGGMSFSFAPGASNPAMQEVQLRKRGTGTLDWTLEATTSDGGNWLTVSATAGGFPATVQVGVVASALPGGGALAGSFVGELVFRSAGNTATIPVSVTVGANVHVQLPAITFTKTFGGAQPLSQDVTIASTGANFNFDYGWYTANGTPWLTVTSAGFNCCTTPRVITANIVAGASLPVGTYTGEILTTMEGNGSSAMLIPVILTVNPPASPSRLSIAKTHTGTITAGQPATYTVTVSNEAGAGPTSSTVTVTETAPSGMTITSMSGTGWSCAANTCSRSDALAPGATYPPIVVAVSIAANATFPVVNAVGVSGGGSPNANTTDSSCTYSLSGTSAFSSAASTGSVAIAAQTGCPWTLVNSASWLHFTSAASGSGNGSVNYTVDRNTTAAQRSAVLSIGATSFTILQGGEAPIGIALRFVPVPPCRIADTRNAAGPLGGPILAAAVSRDFPIQAGPCNIPATALAYSLNLTVVPPGPLGFLSAWPAGQAQPVVSTLNSLDGRIKANAAIVPAGTGGAITLFASHPTHAIIDINGYFVPASAPGSLQFYPLTPCRITDTRLGTGPLAGPALAAGISRSFPILSGTCNVPATAQAYALNMTVVPSTGTLGFLSVWPSGSPQPSSSTLNAPTGAITANAAIVPAGTAGAVTAIATHPTDLIIDINGYFAPPGAGGMDFYTATPCRVVDTRDPAGHFGGPQLAASVSREFVVAASTCSVPATAGAYSLNATVVPPAGLGFLSMWGSGGQPVVSTLNAVDGTIVANAALVPASSRGSVTAIASHATQLILDINGYFK